MDKPVVGIEVPSGAVYAMPLGWDAREFTLPGNYLELEGGSLALFDETTQTGAYFCGFAVTPYWIIFQPTTREIFFDDQVPSWHAQGMALQGGSGG